MMGTDLFQRAKQIFPTAPDDTIVQGLNNIKQRDPSLDDDSIIAAASHLKDAQANGGMEKAIVQADLKNKYNIGDYSTDKRQALVDNVTQSGNPLAAALAGFGAGVRGGNVSSAFDNTLEASKAGAKTQLESFDKNRGLALQNRDDDLAQAKLARESDPNSLESKTAQNLAVSMGMDPSQAQGLTAAKFKDFSPALEKRYQIAERSKDRQQMLSDRQDMRQAQLDAKQAQLQDRASANDDKTYDRLTSQLKDDLDPNKGRAGNLGFNQKKVDQAERLQGLMQDSMGNVANLDSRQVEELAIGLNSMLSNSASSAASQVKALVPSTAMGDAMHLKEWLMNDPTGVNQTEFVKRMGDTVEREKQIAGEQVKKAQVQRLVAYKKLQQGRPDEFASIVRGYGIDPDKDIDKSGMFISKRNQAAPSGEDHSGVAIGSTMQAPKIGEEQEGHIYKGGDPADPKSWEVK